MRNDAAVRRCVLGSVLLLVRLTAAAQVADTPAPAAQRIDELQLQLRERLSAAPEGLWAEAQPLGRGREVRRVELRFSESARGTRRLVGEVIAVALFPTPTSSWLSASCDTVLHGRKAYLIDCSITCAKL